MAPPERRGISEVMALLARGVPSALAKNDPTFLAKGDPAPLVNRYGCLAGKRPLPVGDSLSTRADRA